jgi:hypothetical protein
LEDGQRIVGKVIAFHITFSSITLPGSGAISLVRDAFSQTWPKECLDPSIACLETPTGFKLYSAQVAGRRREFLKF